MTEKQTLTIKETAHEPKSRPYTQEDQQAPVTLVRLQPRNSYGLYKQAKRNQYTMRLINSCQNLITFFFRGPRTIPGGFRGTGKRHYHRDRV